MPSWNIIAEFTVALATIILAFFTFHNTSVYKKEFNKNLRIEYFIKAINEFYSPLINELSSTTLKCMDTYVNLNKIIREKAYLIEGKAYEALPTEKSWSDSAFIQLLNQGCSPEIISITYDPHDPITFEKKEHFDEWMKFADALWEDYIIILKELNKLESKSTEIKLKKPEWKLRYT